MKRKLHTITGAWWLPGAAMTIPWFGNRTVIIYRTREPEVWLVTHEGFHGMQLQEWGAWRYLWKHIKARIATGSLYAKCSDVERDAYMLGYRVRYPEMTDRELLGWMGCSGNPQERNAPE